MPTKLLVVNIDGTTELIPNGSAEGISHAVGGPFAYARIHPEFGYYIHDEGMLEGLALNMPVAMLCGAVLYGPAVLISANTDEGDTLAARPEIVAVQLQRCEQWKIIVANAAAAGQEPYAYADPDTVPPPTIVGFDSEEELFKALGMNW